MKEISPGIFVEARYPDINLGVITSPEGLACVDAPPSPSSARQWVARLRSTFGLPIRYLILTDYSADRALTAHVFHARVVAHEETHRRLHAYGARFPTPVIESLASRYDLARMELGGAPVVPPQISCSEQATVHLGDREITLLHMPSATPASIWVYLRAERVLFTGDSVVVGQHPPLAEADSKAWLDALVRLRRKRFVVQAIVPGRGPLCDKTATEPISDYIRMARRRVYSLYRAGRPRADTTGLIPLLLPSFPHTHLPQEWLHRQIKMGLDHIYDELKAGEAPSSYRS